MWHSLTPEVWRHRACAESCLPVGCLATLCCTTQQWVDMSQYVVISCLLSYVYMQFSVFLVFYFHLSFTDVRASLYCLVSLWQLFTHIFFLCFFFVYFPDFEKMKVMLCNHNVLCVSVNPAPHELSNACTSCCDTWYIMAPELISVAHFINPSHLSVCLYV
jgi:hypothetical protein